MEGLALARHSQAREAVQRRGLQGPRRTLVFTGFLLVLASQAPPPAAAQPGGEQALRPLQEADRLLSEARLALAELDEPKALRALAQAQSLLSTSLSLPLSAAFLAEVELQLAVAATQAGNTPLAEASLQRAARFAPRRKLLLGEASPELVASATRIWNEVANAPEGDLPVEVEAPGARVWLDDVELGAAPLHVRAKVGPHVLRIEAPGYLPYGTLLEVQPGGRPVQRFVLAADPSMTTPRLQAQHLPAGGVTAASSLSAPVTAKALSHGAEASAVPLWQRWVVWSALGVLVVSAGAWLAVSLAPEPEQRLRVVVDPTDLR
jgi:PEGA domain